MDKSNRIESRVVTCQRGIPYMPFGSMLQLIGLTVILFSVLVDLIYPGKPGFGSIQYAGTVVGFILVLTGLRELFAPGAMLWTWALLAVYVAGIAFIGMIPSPHVSAESIPLLGMGNFSGADFFINVFGFLPFGYLLMSCLVKEHSTFQHRVMDRPAWSVLAAGVGASLLIELCQHWFIPGRFSSVVDWFANGVGTWLGIVLFRLARQWNAFIHKRRIGKKT